MTAEGRYIEKRLKEASEYESEGKIHDAVGIYTELGGEYFYTGIDTAIDNGLIKKSIDILLENNEKSKANNIAKDYGKKERYLQKYLIRSLRKYKLSSDLQDPIISRKLLNNKKEFEPSLSETHYKN